MKILQVITAVTVAALFVVGFIFLFFEALDATREIIDAVGVLKLAASTLFISFLWLMIACIVFGSMKKRP